jgi:hypothetical protein
VERRAGASRRAVPSLSWLGGCISIVPLALPRTDSPDLLAQGAPTAAPSHARVLTVLMRPPIVCGSPYDMAAPAGPRPRPFRRSTQPPALPGGSVLSGAELSPSRASLCEHFSSFLWATAHLPLLLWLGEAADRMPVNAALTAARCETAAFGRGPGRGIVSERRARGGVPWHA